MYLVKLMSGPAHVGEPTFIVLNHAGRNRIAIKRRLAALINVISSGLTLRGSDAVILDLPRIIDNLLEDEVITNGHQAAMESLQAHIALLNSTPQEASPTVRLRFTDARVDTRIEDFRVTLTCIFNPSLTGRITNTPWRHGLAVRAILNRLTTDYPPNVVLGTHREDFVPEPYLGALMNNSLEELFPPDTIDNTSVPTETSNESLGTSGFSFQYRSLPTEFFATPNKKSSKPPKPKLVPSEDEMIVNVEELASDLANHRLKSENLTVDKNIERYNRYLKEYTEIIDKAKAARKD